MSEPTPAGGAHAAPGPGADPGAHLSPVVGPPTVPGRHRAASALSPGRLPSAFLWPLAALVVVGLVAARTLRGTPLPDDGALAGPASALLRGTSDLDPVSPEGLGALHTAVYATVTRAFQRHASLVGAERELLLVVLLASAVLLWRTARRLDVPDGACAVAVLVLGALPGLAGLHAAATPATFAVLWLLLAGWLAGWTVLGTRPPAVVAVLTGLTAALAVLLAPDTLLLLAAGAAAAATLAAASRGQRAGRAVAALVLLVALRLLVQRWDPQAADPARWGGSPTGLVLLSGALVAVGVLAAWRLPRFRAAGAALAVTTVLAAAPPSARPTALLVCLPVAALLAGALAAAAAEAVAGPAPHRRPRVLVAAGLVAAVLLLGVGTAAAVQLSAGARSDFGAAATGRLLDWASAQMPEGAVLSASPRLAAELVHAGADAALVQTGEVPVTASTGADRPVLRATTDAAPAGSAVVARFGRITVLDPDPVQPSAERVTARRDLAAALLANPTVEVPAADAELMSAGQVDPRLLTLLASIGAQYGFALDSLPAVPGEPATALARRAVLRTVDGRELADDPAATDRLRTWLDAQRDPYLPDRVALVDGGLLIGYRLVPDPDALVTPSGGR